jgi:phage-related minor tail protein
MTEEVIGKAKIVVEADSSGVTTGVEGAKRSLASLGLAAKAAGKEGSAGMAGLGTGAQQNADKVDAASKKIAESLKRVPVAASEAAGAVGKLTTEQLRFVQSTNRAATLATDGRAAYLEQRAAVLGVSQAVSDSIAKLRAAEIAQTSLGMSAKATAAALRTVPAQLTDVVTSLQGGQAPLTVLLQQGGQIKDMFGGIGPAVRAVGGYVAGLVNPFTVAAAAAAGLGLALYKTEASLRDSNGLAVQLQATGRSAELGRMQAEALRKELEMLPGVTRDVATSTILEFTRTRQIGTAMFRDLALTVADFAAATGTTAPEAAKALAKAFADPAKGAKDLDESLKVLTASQLITIQRLADMGDRAGAQRVLLDALKVSVKGLADDALTPLGKAANEFGNSWERAMNSMGDSTALRTLNTLLAGIVTSSSWLIDHASKLPSGVLGYAWAGPVGAAAVGAANLMGKASASASVGGATGTWQPATAELDEHVKTLLTATATYKSTAGAIDDLRGKAKQLADTIARLRSTGRGDSGEAKELQDRLAGVNERIKDALKKGAVKVGADAFSTEAVRDYAKGLDDLGKVSLAAAANADHLSKAQAKLAEIQAAPTWASFSRQQREQLIYSASLAQADEDRAAASLLASKAAKEAAEDIKSGAAARADAVTASLQSAVGAETELAQFGLLKTEIQRLTLVRLEEARTSAALAGEDVADIDRRIDAQKRLIDATRGLEEKGRIKDTLQSIDQTAQRVWTNVFESGNDAFHRLGQTLKASVLDVLYQLTAKRFIVNVGTQLTGSASQAGITALGSAGGGFQPSSLLSLAGSTAGTFGSGLTAGFSALTGEAGLSGAFSAGTTAIGAGNVAGGLGTLVGAAGPYVAAAMVAYNLLNKKAGGPRASGYYGPNVEQHADNSLGSTLKSVVDQYDQQLSSFLKVAGSASTAHLGLSVSTDPKGTAQTHLANSATLDGAVVYHRWDGNIGRDEASLTAAIDSQAKEAFLNALKSANIGGALGEYLAGADILAGVDAVYTRITTALTQRASLEETMFQLTATEAQKLSRARDQERASMDATNLSLLDQIHQQQDLAAAAEKAKAALANVTSALDSALSGYRTSATSGIGRGEASAQIQAALAISKAGGTTPDTDKLRDAISVLSQVDQGSSTSVRDFVRQRDKEAQLLEQLKAAYEGTTTAPVISAAQAAANQAATTAASTAATQDLQRRVDETNAKLAAILDENRRTRQLLDAVTSGNASLAVDVGAGG